MLITQASKEREKTYHLYQMEKDYAMPTIMCVKYP